MSHGSSCTARATARGSWARTQPTVGRGAPLRAAPHDIVLPVEAEVARSWKLEQSGKPSIPLPRKLAVSQLSGDCKRKLQTLYDSCWTPEELERRRIAIQQRGELGSAEYDRHHEVVKDLHRKAYQRLVDRAATVLSGRELEQVHSIVNPNGTP